LLHLRFVLVLMYYSEILFKNRAIQVKFHLFDSYARDEFRSAAQVKVHFKLIKEKYPFVISKNQNRTSI
jgi:hypothetical protein